MSGTNSLDYNFSEYNKLNKMEFFIIKTSINFILIDKINFILIDKKEKKSKKKSKNYYVPRKYPIINKNLKYKTIKKY